MVEAATAGAMDGGDEFDYGMSDAFVSATRQRPCRIGFRARSWREARENMELRL